MKRVGVCSWSLQPGGVSDLSGLVEQCGLSHVQLALEPIASGLWGKDAVGMVINDPGICVCSGMMEAVGEDYSTRETIRRTGGVRPDEHWEANLERARQNAAIAHELGIGLITLHAGFLPSSGTLEYRKISDRIRVIADIFGEQGALLGLETGQESPEELMDLLDQPGFSQVGVNFDPANMILYGSGDPACSFELL